MATKKVNKARSKDQKAGDQDLHGGEPGMEHQAPRRNQQNMGRGDGTRVQGANQGREIMRGRVTENPAGGRHGRKEKGDAARSKRK